MAGLVQAIHAAPLPKTFDVGDRVTAWMAGTSPAMTMGHQGGIMSLAISTPALAHDERSA
jgi:hypothetical protein